MGAAGKEYGWARGQVSPELTVNPGSTGGCHLQTGGERHMGNRALLFGGEKIRRRSWNCEMTMGLEINECMFWINAYNSFCYTLEISFLS